MSTEFIGRQISLTHIHHDNQPITNYYYFFHIPKTAGVTVKAYLANTLDQSQHLLFSGTFVKDLLNQIEAIKKYQFFAGHFMGFLDPFLGVKTHKATILRDPADRVISHYFHSLRDDSLPLHALIKERPLQDILTDETTNGFAVNYQAKYLAALVDDQGWLEHTLHFRSSPKSDQELLDKALAGLALMEVVGIHENLPSFFQRLSAKWPIGYSSQIPSVNIGDNRNDQLLSADSLQIIYQLNKVDYKIYEEAKKAL